jgi:hypothetical protein
MPDTPLLVVSCDRYADLWQPFFQLFHLRWPSCPFPVFLGTNHKSYADPNVTTIAIGDDESWASGLRRMLEELQTDYVIMFLEDFLLTGPVDGSRIKRMVALARDEELGCLRLVSELPLADPPTRALAARDDVGEITKGTLNRVTAQVAIWRVETLMKLLIPGATAWEFEMVGSLLSERLPDPFWGVWEGAVRYEQVVEKGKWKPEGLRICADAGVDIDLGARDVFSHEELARHYDLSMRGTGEGEARRRASLAFRCGYRREGLRWIAKALRIHPASVRFWATAAMGVVGPAPLRWLEHVYLDWRVAAIRRRVRLR